MTAATPLAGPAGRPRRHAHRGRARSRREATTGSGRRSPATASTSRSSPSAPPASSSSCSTASTTSSRHGSSSSTRSATGPVPTGTSTCAGLGHGQLYGYRVHGPVGAARRPAVRRDEGPPRSVRARRSRHRRPIGGSTAGAPTDGAVPMKSVVVDGSDYDWEGDQRIERPFRHTVIYEAHVAGFTADPSSGVAAGRRGTYAGFIDKIPYLVDLGDHRGRAPAGLRVRPPGGAGRPGQLLGLPAGRRSSPRTPRTPAGPGRRPPSTSSATWSRRSTGPASRSSSTSSTTTPPRSARTARRSASAASPTTTYYLLDGDGGYLDYSGTGNTFNANNPIVRRLILDSLRYWVEEMHVDGFRFDLAAVLSRDEAGEPMANPPALWDIETDPALAGTKLIAEAWDAGGLYQVGSFVGDRWVRVERPVPRRRPRASSRATAGMVGAVGQRFLGSPDIYGHKHREPAGQHQLRHLPRRLHAQRPRLVRREAQRGERRGQPRRQRREPELELRRRGPDRRPRHRRLRGRQVRNLLSSTSCPSASPMLLMGDEVRRTQGGNNNAYCHDDATSWFDWTARRAPRRHPAVHPGPHPHPAAGSSTLLDMPVEPGS